MIAGRGRLAKTALRSGIIGKTAARRLAGAALFAGAGITGVGAIMGLTVIGKAIFDAINKGNDNASDFYKGQGNQQFSPFAEGL